MRKLILALSIFISVNVCAQQSPPEVTIGKLVAVRKPTLISGEPAGFVPRITRDENGLVGVPKKTAIIRNRYQNAPAANDPVLQQTGQANRPLTPNSVNVATATIGTNVNGIGFTGVNPSDPVVATGPNHVIQMINGASGSVMKIFNKNGSQVAAQFNFSSITNVQGAGDPILLYDQLAKRWLLTEFGYSGGITSFVNTLILAVSASDDPLGSWYVYAYADNSFFVDFPKFSVWTDGYYATSNDFNTSGTAYLGSSVYAFNRTAMLAGNPTATAIRTRLTSADNRYFSMAPVSLEGPAVPPVNRRSMFLYYTNDEFTSDPADVDSIYMITMTPDFVTPANTVISAPTRFVPAAFDDELCTATRGRCIDQQTNTTTDLEDLTGRFSNKIVYRNFGTHEGIVCNFTVDADGAGKGGIRWTELRNTGSWSLFQQGTWAPDGEERWLGSACYDGVGNIGLVYNVSGTATNPSIRFTARNACDAAGTMTLPETVIINGTNSNGSSRYGDYNVLTIDPATDRDFWLTAQHNNGSGNWNTRIATFSLNNCNAQPRVRFQTNAVSAYEDSLRTAGTGCQRYRDYTVNVVIDAAPSQPAIVTFTTSGTATNGSDYTITPASVTLNGSTLSQPVTIRVFADNNIEGTESVNISYTINASGGNAVADNYNQAFSMSIVDNDNAISPQGTSGVMLSEGFGTTAAPGPSSGTWTVINTNVVTNTWVYSGNGGTGITSGAAHITNNTTTNSLAYTLTISDTATLRTPLINATAFTAPGDVLQLFIRYKCNGELFSGTYYDFGRLRYSTDGTNFITIPGSPILQGVTAMTDLRLNLPASLKGQQFYIGFYWQNDNSDGSQPPFTLDSIAVVNTGIRLEATAGSSGVGYFTATQQAPVVSSADGELIATVANMNNIGCLTGTLVTAGTGRQSATINGTAAFRSDKVVQLTPDVAYPGTYRATIYFTTAEMAVWGAAATGLNILKVPDADPLGATISGTVVTATVDDQRATRGFIAYSANFTGFSKFAVTNAGVTTVPVLGLQFAARALTQSILLNWSTRAEFNSRNFVIERSTNGTQFTTIGTVAARGNTNQLSQYSFADENVLKGTTYYYRLRQVDIDGKELFSEIRTVRLGDTRGNLVLQPNPAHHSVRIIVDGKHSQALISITDAAGKTILQQNRANGMNGLYDINISGLAAGTYTVKVTAGTEVYTEKLVKQ
jgi:Secretion system C-terminal sorting domain